MRPLALALLLAAVVPCASVRAQHEGRLDLATEADIQFELGVDAQRRGDYRTALQHYLASQRLAPNKNVVFNIALCFERLDRFPEAYRYYADYLASDLAEDERTVAREAVERIRPRVALIRVETSPAGAIVYLDRRDLGARGRAPIVLAVATDSAPTVAVSSSDWPGSCPGASTRMRWGPGATASTIGARPRAPRSRRSRYTIAPGGEVSTRISATRGRMRSTASRATVRSSSARSLAR